MTTSSGQGSPPPAKRLSRQERLAAELRANLHRRKAKARATGAHGTADETLRIDPVEPADKAEPA